MKNIYTTIVLKHKKNEAPSIDKDTKILGCLPVSLAFCDLSVEVGCLNDKIENAIFALQANDVQKAYDILSSPS